MKKLLPIILLLPLFCWLFPTSLMAGEDVREVTGYGVTKKEATVNALLEAIQQVKGAKLRGVEDLRSYFEEDYATKNGQDSSSSRMSSSQHEDIHREVQGLISSYEVLDMSQGENGHGWQATLRVTIPVYEPPGISPHSRRKLAVMPFRTAKYSFSLRGIHIPAVEISRQFTQKLVTELTQSRRFTVLDREYICEYFREKNLLLSGDTPLEEQVRLGQVLGVDYILVGTITSVELKRIPYNIKVLGKTGYKDTAILIADYRIIVMPNRQTKWADSVTLKLNSDALHKLAGSKDPEMMQQALLAEGARIIAHKALANIYPIRISAIQPDGTLILNQGGITVSKGELFDVFSVGDKVIDAYSRESLGAAETWVATAKVDRVLAKQTYVRVTKGNVEKIKAGDICRRAHKERTVKPAQPKMNVPW